MQSTEDIEVALTRTSEYWKGKAKAFRNAVDLIDSQPTLKMNKVRLRVVLFGLSSDSMEKAGICAKKENDDMFKKENP